ncbi:diacylglycerol kinase [uncultured Cobetia sp.]|jgi:diacylglycerol kinase (ATP)|uniref:diacylglycerol kinase n=1 Tax=uncultured Cobetia sp. TaxID=410706 RepID=UPI0030EF1072
MKSRHTGLTHLKHSARYSLKGLKAAWSNEEAFRQEIVLCALLLPFAWWIGDSHVEWLLLVGSTLIVLIVELLNSAVESAIDRIGPEFHELSGRAKDMGSAAVMISLIFAGLTWGTLLYDKLFG